MKKIKAEIESLLYENAEDFKIAKVLKKEIKTYFETLEDTFATSGGKDFLVQHTKKIDDILKIVYKVAQREMFGDYAPMKNSIPIAMVALGSYGREQLCVYSDIDLMLVYKDVPGYNIKVMIEKILYMLWDTGLKLGHRVHEVDELFDVSRTDITIKTAFIESRFIEGSVFVWTEVQNAITRIRHDNPKKFIEDKLEEQRIKHKKYPLTMEPNLKVGVGGFRDANLIFWIGKVLFNTNNIKNLPLEVVTQKDYRNFRMALEFLFRVRSALHLAAGKKEDTLRLDLIPDVAKYLGYKHTPAEHRKFTQRVTGSLKTLRLYSIIWLEILSRDYVDERFDMHTVYPNHEVQDVNALLTQLIKNAKQPFVVHPTYLQKLINAVKPEVLDKRLYKNIEKIFYQNHAYSILSTLSYAKLLYYIIPPIAKVVNLPQFDGYHQYAVDIHSLRCLEYLEDIKDPFIQNLFNALSKEEKMMLKVVTFLHDAGKGRAKDHHQVGVMLFRNFATKLHMDSKLIKTGEQLILYHTLMSKVAQQEDLHNEKVILNFASHFPSKKYLDLIYILTCADMSGVGNDVYNDFSARLIKTLYYEAIESLKHETILNETAKRVKKELQLKKNSTFLSLKRSEQKKILTIPSNLLFVKYAPNEIMKITKQAFSIKGYAFHLHNNSHLSIEIFRKDILNLGYLLAKLSYLKVRKMDITKLFDGCKYFKIDFEEKVSEDDLSIIETFIHDAFVIKERGILQIPSIKRSEVYLDSEHSKSFAALYLNTIDQKGLLAYVVDSFDALGLDISSAKVHTLKKQTKDIFLIEKNANFCHNTEQIIDKLIGNN